MTQHGNGSKIIFEEFPFFQKFEEIPQKFRIVEGFPNISYQYEEYQQYEETDLKFEETDQQIEIFKVFEKSGNGSKI